VTDRVLARKAIEESERRFRAIVNTTPECVKIIAADGTLLHMNATGLMLIGAECAEDALGKNIYDVVAPEDRARFRSFNEQICSGQKGTLEFDIVGLNGIRRHMESHAVPLQRSDGTTAHLAVTRDVTERRAAESALVRAEKLAAAGRLAATIAHEINNPLEAVTNLLYLLRSDRTLNAEAQQLLETAEQELTRVSHIARQTLGFYRDTATPARCNVASHVDEVLAVYSKRVETQRTTLLREYGAAVEITCYPGELRQVISNLISNAIDATAEGFIRVRVRRRRHLSSGREGVRITVADTGTGISRKRLQHVFEPFFTTKKDVGTGLGLWVCQNIVTKHGGSIRVRSSTAAGRRGSVFSIFLPDLGRALLEARGAA
jgi:PAS domain S-box-containing protein